MYILTFKFEKSNDFERVSRTRTFYFCCPLHRIPRTCCNQSPFASMHLFNLPSLQALKLSSLEYLKAQGFFETTFGRICRGRAATGFISWVQNQILFCPSVAARKNYDFCLVNYPRQGIRMTFSSPWQEICTFWQRISTLC